MDNGPRITQRILHPVNGAVVEDDLDTLTNLEAHVDKYLRRQNVHYNFRKLLRERIAELRGPAVLPRPRYRTERQSRVAECPRCSGKN